MNSVHDSRFLLQAFPVGFYQILIHNCEFDPYRNGIYKYLHVKSFPLLLLLSCGGCSCFDRFASLFHLWSLNLFFGSVEMVCAPSLSLSMLLLYAAAAGVVDVVVKCVLPLRILFQIRFVSELSQRTIIQDARVMTNILWLSHHFVRSLTSTLGYTFSLRLSVLATAICCFSETDIENRINSMVDFGQHHSYSNGSVIDKKKQIYARL